MRATVGRTLVAPHPPARAPRDDRSTDVAWGLFLLWSGIIWLLPDLLPPGSWMAGSGLLLLGVAVDRYARHAPVGLWQPSLALLVTLVGVADLVDVSLLVLPVVTLTAGALIAARALLEHRRRPPGSTPVQEARGVSATG